jgi:hypothetical protein
MAVTAFSAEYRNATELSAGLTSVALLITTVHAFTITVSRTGTYVLSVLYV